jgi:hypothetical protein
MTMELKEKILNHLQQNGPTVLRDLIKLEPDQAVLQGYLYSLENEGKIKCKMESFKLGTRFTYSLA